MYDGTDRRAEKTCCDECDRLCSEHDLRMELADDIRVEIKQMKRESDAKYTQIEPRISGVERGYIIVVSSLLVLVGVAAVGYNRADAVQGQIAKHLGDTGGQAEQIRRQSAQIDQESQEIKALSALVIETHQTLKSIDQRLGALERREK